jgi:hypothetical protein
MNESLERPRAKSVILAATAGLAINGLAMVFIKCLDQPSGLRFILWLAEHRLVATPICVAAWLPLVTHEWSMHRRRSAILCGTAALGSACFGGFAMVGPAAFFGSYVVAMAVVGFVVGIAVRGLRQSLLSALNGFRWFLGRENREIVELALGDLKKDVRELEAEGRGHAFINAVVLWRTLCTAVSIVCDGLERVLRAAALIESLMRKLRGS